MASQLPPTFPLFLTAIMAAYLLIFCSIFIVTGALPPPRTTVPPSPPIDQASPYLSSIPIKIWREKIISIGYGMYATTELDEDVVDWSAPQFDTLDEGDGACPGNLDTPMAKYKRTRKLGAGGYGETWLVTPRCRGHKINLVLKRLFMEANPDAYMSGHREIYFGELFNSLDTSLPGVDNLARFVEYFDSSNQLFLVSRYEGISLYDALYKSDGSSSNWWTWLKTTSDGNNAIREMMYQMMSGVARLHQLNITHRDLKPGNIAICFYNDVGDCISMPIIPMPRIGLVYLGLHVRLIDFGSGIDPMASDYLYGPLGPSRYGQTKMYSSPECTYNRKWLIELTDNLDKYDIFSLGITFVEIILGTPRVLNTSYWESINSDIHTGERDLPYDYTTEASSTNIYDRYSIYSDMCIGERNLPLHCRTEASFMKYIKGRDPHNQGFPGLQAMRLAKQLLHWDVKQRITAQKALKHPYFQGRF